jgi:hypothetical protein
MLYYNMKTEFLSCDETFNADYLNYIINNFVEFKPLLRWRDRYDEIDPFKIIKKYLHRSRHGNVRVDYKQNDGKGRFCAVGSMSLQTIPREIRQTICKDYYIDIDMCNAHPIILEWLCKKNGFECKELSNYIQNRDELLNKVKFNGKYTKDKAKQVYLALTNGGVKDYQESDNIKEKDIHDIETLNDDLTRYKTEMIRLHRLFSQTNQKGFEKVKEKRKKANKDYNHEAGFMNTLLCDMENTLLMDMYKYFGTPKNAVLCFDGIMLRNNKEYNILGCQEHIIKKYNMPLFKLSVKEMTEFIDMSKYNIPKYEYFKLDYYADFRNLIKQDEIYEEWLEEWNNNALKLIENDGKQYFITRNKRVVVFSDKTKEIRDEWKPIKTEEIEKSLKVKIKTKNIYYDYHFHQKYKAMKKKEKDDINISKEELNKLINWYSYTTIGNTNIKLGDGYLSYLMEERKIDSYNSTDFYPLLQRKEKLPLEDTFNLFTQFPFEDREIKENINFEDSLLCKHLREDFFNNDENELNHFLDHIADIIQDPARIKGTSHLFYSPQGCGKGLLFKFMGKILGISNVISIINTDTYFDKNFNSDVGNKLLKVFEEVSEKGSAFKNHNRLKGEQTSETERIEPKGIDPYYNRHCARFWYFTNNENSLYIENDDRRHTLHRISAKHQNNYDYFKPIWDEIKDEEFLKNAFEYFATRKYDEKNVMNSYTTQYKKEQKDANLPNGIKFILDFVNKEFDKIEDKDIKITSETLKDKYKLYCADIGIKYHINTLNTQIRKIGILEPKQLNFKYNDGSNRKKFCYKINTWKMQEEMKRFLQDDDFLLQGSINKIEEYKSDDLYKEKRNCDFDNSDFDNLN